jgi:hypothetical protein
MKASKEIELKKVENGWIITVNYYEKFNEFDTLVNYQKQYVAMTEKDKEEIIKSLGE